MNIIKPKKLQKGDTIGIISLCGKIKNSQNIYNSQLFFEKRGYKTVLSENIFDSKRYFAGEDAKKIQNFHEFIKNPEIKMILCARGGCGAIRLIKDIDYNLIRNNPKIFAGYSDVTALSSMILKKSGLITFSSPMPNGDFSGDISEFTADNFFKTISNTEDLVLVADSPTIYKHGNAEGILFGGNLATIVSLCGQDFIPDEKFIFFAEDINEDVYKIDRMFTQLLNIDKFKENLSGIVLGEFMGIQNPDELDEVLYEVANLINKPVIKGFKISHGKDKVTVPIGANAKLCDEKLQISPYLI